MRVDDDEDEAIPAPPKGVQIMREVTDDKGFTSSALARMSKKDQRRLVQKLYGKDGTKGV